MNKEERQKKWREQKQNYRNRHKTVCISFTQTRGKELGELAMVQKLTLPDFLKSLVEAHVNGNGYVVSENGNIERLSYLLRRVSNSINQLVRYAHIEQGVTYNDLQKLQQQLSLMEAQIKNYLSLPPDIETVIVQHISNNPGKREQLIQFISSYKP